MDLQKRNVDVTEVVVIAFGRVADEELAIRVVVLHPIFERTADEAATDNSNVNHD